MQKDLMIHKLILFFAVQRPVRECCVGPKLHRVTETKNKNLKGEYSCLTILKIPRSIVSVPLQTHCVKSTTRQTKRKTTNQSRPSN